MGKLGVVLVVFGLLLASCTSDATGADPNQEQVEKELPAPEAPRHVAAARVDSNMNAKHVHGCLYDEPVEISTLAGQYYGPMDLVQGEVEAAREVSFTLPADIQMLEKADFGRELKAGYRPLRATQRKVNRWLEWNLGYRPFESKAESSGDGSDLVAGVYDPRSDKVLVHQQGELDAEYIVLAHEFAHAAVDQNFGIRDKFSPLTVDDKSLAYRALVEGDASLTEFRIASKLVKPDAVRKSLRSVLTSAALFKKDEKAGVPHASTDRFVFPYRWGTAFVCSVFRKEGWEGVNGAHRKPPESTAEIMFPERYLKREHPKKPESLNKPPKDWKLFAKGTIGAAHLKALFEAPGSNTHRALGNPLGRAAAWNGGMFRLWARELGTTNSLFAMSFVEHEKHEGVLCSSMIKWYRTTFPVSDHEVLIDDVIAYTDAQRAGIVDCRGNDVKVAIAPELELANDVLEIPKAD